jgi:hypothetical protein
MKFRTTFKRKFVESIVLPIVIGISFFAISPYFFRFYSNRIVFYRPLKLIFACNATCISWMYLNAYPWQTPSLHDVITQPEPNGKYVRTILRDQFPRNWSLISKQLQESGYNFREMNEYSDKLNMPDVTYKFDNSMY